MGRLLLVIVTMLQYAIDIMQLIIVVRAVLSWIPFEEENSLENIIIKITEPVQAPIRAVLERISLFQSLPIDFSGIIAYVILYFIKSFLGLLI